MKKKLKTLGKLNIILFAILGIITIILGMVFRNPIENRINTIKNNSSLTIYDDLICYFIDVNQGDAICLKLPDNKFMLIDTGNYDNDSKNKLFKTLEKIVFKDVINPIFDYVILTHADSDHCGSMADIFNKYECKNFYRPNQFISGFENLDNIDYDTTKNLLNKEDNISFYQTIVASYNEENLNVFYNKEGIVIENLDFDYKFEFLSPHENSYTQSNDYSPIILLTYKDNRILFTGDATTKIENKVLEKYPNLTCDFIKLGHHGSNTSTGANFVKALKPSYAFISCEKDNSYNFPHSSVISNLEFYANMKESNIYRTDIDGNIILSFSSNGEFSIYAQNSHTIIFIKVQYLILFILTLFTFVCVSFHLQINKKLKSLNGYQNYINYTQGS